jgi:hypothetical protein
VRSEAAGHTACDGTRGGKYVKRISLTLRTRDWATSVAGFMTVLTTLVIFDERVAHQLAVLSRRGPDRELLVMREWASSFVSVVMMAARDQSLDHAPMLVFTMVAILLVIFMVRT